MLKLFKSPFFLLLGLVALLPLTSCDENALQEDILIDITTEEDMPDLLEASLLPPPSAPEDPTPEAQRTPCFRFVYPVSVVLRNGTILEAQNPQDLRRYLQRIREERVRANFVYPFNVELTNGETATIERFRDFRRLVNFCIGRDYAGDEPCFRYVYPIDVSINDRTLTVNGPRAWRIALRAANRGADVNINYPISVIVPDQDEPLTLNNRQEHNQLRRSCGDNSGDRQVCFRFVYPLDLAVGEETITVESATAWNDTILATGQRFQVRPIFPFDITLLATEETITITAADGWAGVRELCE